MDADEEVRDALLHVLVSWFWATSEKNSWALRRLIRPWSLARKPLVAPSTELRLREEEDQRIRRSVDEVMGVRQSRICDLPACAVDHAAALDSLRRQKCASPDDFVRIHQPRVRDLVRREVGKDSSDVVFRFLPDPGGSGWPASDPGWVEHTTGSRRRSAMNYPILCVP